jgi:hypothetical protein
LVATPSVCVPFILRSLWRRGDRRRVIPVNYAELFYLVDAGEGRWTVRHALTDELAGSIMRTDQGLVLRDDNARFLGTFPTVEVALRNLYALV